MRTVFSCVACGIVGLLCLVSGSFAAPATQPAGLFVRAALQSPAEREWRVQVVAQRPGGKAVARFAGATVAETEKAADFAKAGAASAWVDLSDAKSPESTVRFLFQTKPTMEKTESGLRARIDVATAPEESAILRSVVEHDPGNVIAVRIPPRPREQKDRILTVREDTQRRLDEVKSFNLPDVPRPAKIWCMTGFRSNGEFYTDPEIAKADFEIIRRLGMNGWWQQSGGQPGALREMAHSAGMDRSTVYWRSVESLPRDKDFNGATRLDWDALDQFLDKAYRSSIDGTRKQHPGGMPEVIADLMDEPAGQHFDGPEYADAFRQYLRQQGLTLAFFGKENWQDLSPIVVGWRKFFGERGDLNRSSETERKRFYWSIRFWNHCTARAYAMATAKVERYAPGVQTRVNFGPPWWYDYGTWPRGIDAFEFGRLRGVSMGFNEDWVGKGNSRIPLESNTLLMDWSRAAARPNTPLLGAYITRDADRASVKLRAFACLAREAKVFDFYYYGPSYTFFDHWADNGSMVRGVGELTRDIAAADDLLWAGRAPKAEVALLYSRSWPVWKADDTEQNEQMMAYLALLHAGIPVDIVSDEEVADGRFAARRYKALYVVNESVPTAAARAVEQWVRDGGRLWCAGWAGMRDEYNSPTEVWNDLLGVRSRTWRSTGDLARLGQPIEPADWKRPIFGRAVTIDADPKPAAKAFEITGPAGAGRAYDRSFGKGVVRVIPWAAGAEYLNSAAEKDGALAHAVRYASDHRRNIYADFAIESKAELPAVTSADQVLAWPLWSQQGGVVLLANFTGEAVDGELKVTFTSPRPVTNVRSIRHGACTISQPDPRRVEVRLPMKDVTDILIVE